MTLTQSRPAAPRLPAPAGLPVGSKATIFGLSLFVAAALVLVLHAILVGAAPFIVIASIFAVVPALLIVLVRRYGGWPLIVTASLMLLTLVMEGRNLVEGLFHPTSFMDFVPSVLGLPGVLIALGAAVVAYVARRRGDRRSAPTPVERLAARGAVVLLTLLVALSGVLTMTVREGVSAQAKAGATPVQMKGTAFKPGRLEARAGEAFRIVVKNDDPGAHSLTIEALDVDVNVNPGSERLIEIPALPAGEYPFVCSLFGHEAFMKGVLVVQ